MIRPDAYAMPYPATTNWICASVARNSAWAEGMATFTMKKSRIVMNAPTRITGRASQRRRPRTAVPAGSVAREDMLRLLVVVEGPGQSLSGHGGKGRNRPMPVSRVPPSGAARPVPGGADSGARRPAR
ncbi:hypothetical protein ACQP2K_24120 [Microbispora siamensis]